MLTARTGRTSPTAAVSQVARLMSSAVSRADAFLKRGTVTANLIAAKEKTRWRAAPAALWARCCVGKVDVLSRDLFAMATTTVGRARTRQTARVAPNSSSVSGVEVVSQMIFGATATSTAATEVMSSDVGRLSSQSAVTGV